MEERATVDPRFQAIHDDGARAMAELGLPADAEVLDVGTGSGSFAVYLATWGCRVLTGEPATDTSQYAGRDWAVEAEKAGVRDRIRFEFFDAAGMPFAGGRFAAVFFFGVLHHIGEAARKDVLREALRVATAEGAVVFLEPRQEMLELVRRDDPEHPPAANPAEYLSGANVREQRIDGSQMDIYIYRKGD